MRPQLRQLDWRGWLWYALIGSRRYYVVESARLGGPHVRCIFCFCISYDDIPVGIYRLADIVPSVLFVFRNNYAYIDRISSAANAELEASSFSMLSRIGASPTPAA